ncbi:lipopolysaccharide biosynthesis protein [Aestuariivivens sediminicola]|uniref:lipopolysaccharide biosynthesis protein n=1 Tax=Aestuariivivens sediminicola TaxID=2913560 RepID=UPI001F5875B5|nr:polysaccharide biosynthesis C-terminal domain-containing protein [Aestuariivivens sediminicola]
MGLVVTQSIKNTITTYIGFVIGGVNVLFLFTNFLSDAYFGLVQYIFSTAAIMMPLMAFGVHNTLVKFYSSFKTRQSQNSFLTIMLVLPLCVALPVGLIGYLCFEGISVWMSSKNDIIRDYIWLIYVSAIFLAYFEVFYAWSKVQMRSVFGNFMKEIFHRLCTTVLLFTLYFDIISVNQFIYALVIVHALRMLTMALYAFSLRLPVICFSRLLNMNSILSYSALIILAGSVANIILELDKFMIGLYIEIENVAYYAVAIYIASVIAVPSRAMHQITNPLTAKLLNERNTRELRLLYRKSSLTLLIVGGLIFLLIVLNINELYYLIPEKYQGGIRVVILIGLAKLFDNFMGNNNAILFNSDYYRVVLALGLGLVLLTIVLNTYFIPHFGTIGAAYATFISIVTYNSAKLVFVKLRFEITPFCLNTLKVCLILAVFFGLFYYWDFPFHPVLNIALKSVVIIVLYLVLIFRFKLSNDINRVLIRFFNSLK